MATNFKKFYDGITIVPKTSSTVSAAGEIDYDTSANKFNVYNGTSSSPIVTETHTATLTNKTLSGNTAATLISGSGTLTLNTSGTVTLPNATDTLVGKATSDTLTNKILSGNTAVTLISGSGTLTLNTSGTVTLPNATDTLVGKATSDTLTNKTMSGASNTFTNISLTSSVTGTLPTGNGGTGVASVTTSPTASSFAGWDANKNLSSNNFIQGYRTTATAAGTTTLVVGDTEIQYFTGSTTQTVKMPATSTLVTGQQYRIVNLSSGIVTVQSSGANTIQAMAANTQLELTCISTSGTGTASWDWTYVSVEAGLNLTNPMNTSGDIIYGGASGVPTRLAANSTATNKYLQSVSSGVPSYQQVAFSDLSGTASSSQVVTATFTAPTIQKFTSSSGTYTTPTSPRSPLYIRVRMVGGGGGGAGSSTAAANDGGSGGAGGNTTFGSSLLVANGGSGGTLNGGGAAGGTASLGTGPIGTALTGAKGQGPGSGGSTVFPNGGQGAGSPFGGAGGTGPGQAGGAGATNTGSGGAGAGANSASTSYGGAGGGAGGYVDALITSSISATYSYAVGAAGSAGSAGTSGLAGGAGGSGYIEVTEYYQ